MIDRGLARRWNPRHGDLVAVTRAWISTASLMRLGDSSTCAGCGVASREGWIEVPTHPERRAPHSAATLLQPSAPSMPNNKTRARQWLQSVETKSAPSAVVCVPADSTSVTSWAVSCNVLAPGGAFALIEAIDQVDPTLRHRFIGDLLVVCAQSPFYEFKQRCRCLPHGDLQRLHVGSHGEPQPLSAVPYKALIDGWQSRRKAPVLSGTNSAELERRRRWGLWLELVTGLGSSGKASDGAKMAMTWIWCGLRARCPD
jgi:hypothetical protein